MGWLGFDFIHLHENNSQFHEHSGHTKRTLSLPLQISAAVAPPSPSQPHLFLPHCTHSSRSYSFLTQQRSIHLHPSLVLDPFWPLPPRHLELQSINTNFDLRGLRLPAVRNSSCPCPAASPRTATLSVLLFLPLHRINITCPCPRPPASAPLAVASFHGPFLRRIPLLDISFFSPPCLAAVNPPALCRCYHVFFGPVCRAICNMAGMPPPPPPPRGPGKGAPPSCPLAAGNVPGKCW